MVLLCKIMRMALIDIYEARIASGNLRADPAQSAVLPALEGLRIWLETPRKTGLVASLFHKSPASPKGIYLWGGVGRGKSMLMDLFFDATDITATPCALSCVYARNPAWYASGSQDRC